MGSGGGGGGGGSQFKAVGQAPGFDYQSAMGLQQLAIGGDIQSYTLSDMDFANRYPALQNAYDTWQANLGQQVGQVQQGYDVQNQLQQGLASQIAGRMQTPTTGDIQALRGAAGTAATAVQPMYNYGNQQAGLAQPITGIGQGINRMGNQLAGASQIPYQLGQQLLQEPIDPQTQQQMMRAGLSSAAGSLGAASLGQGMAGQSAAARQLGLNTLQYGQQMRGEAMQDIGQYASMLGSAGQMKGLGGQTIGLGGQQLQQGAGTIGAGANAAATAGGLYGSAQNMQEQYGMDTANLAGIYAGLQGQQAQNVLSGIQTAGNMFQKRPFGLGGANAAQAEMGQAGALNSFQQANYATMNGIAYNSAQMQAQQNQLNQQRQASQTGMMVSAGTTAAVTGATVAAMAACWVARAVYPDNRWRVFRHWLMNKAPLRLRKAYLVHGPYLAKKVRQNRLLGALVRLLMDRVIAHTAYVYGYT